MSDDDIPPPRFVGRTYGRSRQSGASRAFDEAVDKKSVPLKAEMSLSKWGSTSYSPVHEGLHGASDPKRAKMKSKGDDPFSFHTENKWKLNPQKVEEITEHEKEFNQFTKLPTSKIVAKGYDVIVQKEESTKLQSFHSNSRNAAAKEQLEEIGNNGSTPSSRNSSKKIPSPPSASLHNFGVASSSEKALSVGSTSCLSPSASVKYVTIHSKSAAHNADFTFSFHPNLKSDNSHSKGSSGLCGKRYRIFKSRAPQVEEHKPLVFSEEGKNGWSQHSSRNDTGNDRDSHVKSVKDDRTSFVHEVVRPDRDSQSPLRSTDSSQASYTAGLDFESVDIKQMDPIHIKQIDPLAVREQLAARLRKIEKYADSDSTSDLDNASECSEPLTSQDTPSSSQSVLERGIPNENSTVAPRRFFKSKKSDLQKRLIGNSPQKASYNARSWQSKHEMDAEQEEKACKVSKKDKDSDVVLIKNSEKGPKLKREVHWPETKYDEAYTSLKISKDHKELYTVVRNVKQTHEVQELGETHDFMNEVDYLLDSLRNTNSTAIRCLSCLKLASKCISPAFRMHMRAHGTVSKIFSLLRDACSDPSLALSTSAMMFMLSRDRLNMDLDHDSLSLMLKLNEVDTGDNLRGLDKIKQKVKELLAQLQQETHAREIDLGFVSTSSLALESLLSLTSRRAGEWFKEELRSVGGLDHIVDSVKFCEKSLPEDLSQDIQKALPVLRKLYRYLRVLENISYMNPDNQTYLILYKNAVLLQACTRTLRLCQLCMPTYKLLENLDEDGALKELPGYTILTCMLGVLRVMINITHENQLGDLDMADETSLMETILRCLTTTLWCIPAEQRFDLAVVCLGLLINLVEHREANREIMMTLKTQVKYAEKSHPRTMSAIKAVVELFVQREQVAREMEEDTENSQDTSSTLSPNKSGEWKETDTSIEWITNNLKKAKEEQEKQKKAVRGSAKGEFMEVDEGNQSILEDDEETFTKALHKAGKHMENSIVASYAGLLLGSTIIDNKEYASCVKKLIPNEDFAPMIKMLKKFLNFMSLTTAFGSKDVNAITKVIGVLECS